MQYDEKMHLYDDVIKIFGLSSQTFMVMEECGELLNILAKAMRNRAKRDEIISELADVQIMCEQMAFFYGEREFIAEKERKLLRLKKRLANHESNESI